MKNEMYTVALNPVETGSASPALYVTFAGESQTKPSHLLGPKIYDFYLMHIILSGQGIFRCDGQTYHLRAGHTFLIEPEQLISYESDEEDPWHYRWIAFHGTHAAELVAASGLGRGEQVVMLQDADFAASLFGQVYNTFRNDNAEAADMKAIGYVHLLLAEYRTQLSALHTIDLDTRQSRADQLIKQMIHYLNTQYAQPLSIEQMAESLGYNRAYLSRIFKQHTGSSPVTFLLKLRIDKARLLLRERPELTVEQISASVGLQDALYFSKQFRRIHGVSPTSYRQSISNKPHS